MRLFAGLALAPETIQRLTEFRLRWASPQDGLRWSAPEQWHVTLRFLGEVSEERALTVQTSLAGLRSGQVELRMDSFGVFAVKGILYASVEPSAELSALHQAVEGCVAEREVLPETHPFRPHITLARSKNATGGKTLQRLSRPALPAFGPGIRWIAAEMLLYESLLGAGGARYEVRSRVPLIEPGLSRGG